MSEKRAMAAGQAKARAPRANVLLSAQISGFDAAAPTQHRVRDLSQMGARVDQAHSLKPGATVLVSVGLLEAVGATVMWVEKCTAGLKFTEAIDPDAARSKAFVSPTLRDKNFGLARVRSGSAAGPSAGWLPALCSPYRR